MEIEYDQDVDAAFVWLIERPDSRERVVDAELWPTELKGRIGLLFDAHKRLIGLEVLEASARLPSSALKIG